MITASDKTEVEVADEMEATQEKRTGRFLVFFRTEWWETVSTKYIGSDLYIETNRDIRRVFINGKLSAILKD